MSDRMEEDTPNGAGDMEAQDDEFASISDIQTYFTFNSSHVSPIPQTNPPKHTVPQTISRPTLTMPQTRQIPPDQFVRQQMLQQQPLQLQGLVFPPRNPLQPPTNPLPKLPQPQIVIPQRIQNQSTPPPLVMPQMNPQYANYMQFMQSKINTTHLTPLVQNGKKIVQPQPMVLPQPNTFPFQQRVAPPPQLRVVVPPPQGPINFQTKPSLQEKRKSVVDSPNATTIKLHSSPAGSIITRTPSLGT